MVKFAEYAFGNVTRHLGEQMAVEIAEKTVSAYQSDRLKEKAAPKTINEEVGFLLRLLGDGGEAIRGRMRRERTLKLKVHDWVLLPITMFGRSTGLPRVLSHVYGAVHPSTHDSQGDCIFFRNCAMRKQSADSNRRWRPTSYIHGNVILPRACPVYACGDVHSNAVKGMLACD
jgi:hypothetical protein